MEETLKQLLQEMDLKHSITAIITSALADELDGDCEVDTNAHDAVWITKANGEAVVVRITQVDEPQH